VTWILTATGRHLDLAKPRLSAIAPLDIAWALAQTNRFTGHALRPYSVAEHSLLVCEIAEVQFGLDVHAQLAALTHDAHEAYVGDLCTPAKAAIGQPWHNFESLVELAVHCALQTSVAAHQFAIQIKAADLIALATEKRDLMPRHDAGLIPWPCLDGVEPCPWVRLDSPERTAMGWEDWRDAWLDKYHELDFARTELATPAAEA
jgi:uncharacterized protein